MSYGYPEGWPRCVSCGDEAMDGHLTCGRANCNEGPARRGDIGPSDAEIDANLDRNHNLLCGCDTPGEGRCVLAMSKPLMYQEQQQLENTVRIIQREIEESRWALSDRELYESEIKRLSEIKATLEKRIAEDEEA
jgi:hypothetical protein